MFNNWWKKLVLAKELLVMNKIKTSWLFPPSLLSSLFFPLICEPINDSLIPSVITGCQKHFASFYVGVQRIELK